MQTHTHADTHTQCWPDEKQAKDITPEASEGPEECAKCKNLSARHKCKIYESKFIQAII